MGTLHVLAACSYSLYNTSILNDPTTEPTGDALVAAYQDCEAELDARKANRLPGTPNLNMLVLSDSYISNGVDVVGAYLKFVTTRRNDIMFVGGAWGRYDDNDTYVDIFPFAFPEFTAISSVGVNFTSAISKNLPVNFTAFSAPGEFIIWTSSLREYLLDAFDAWGQRKNTIAASPPLTGVQADFWNSPPPGAFSGSLVGSVTAAVVDCGTGLSPCVNATVSGSSSSSSNGERRQQQQHR
jgi:hypothetical protein